MHTIGLNEAGRDVHSMSGEIRFYRRKTMVWPNFWFFKNYQAAWVLGAEVYRNNNGANFVDGYQLLKSGLSFNVPVANRWETGGEVLIGFTDDFSRKYELSGFLNYFVSKGWAFGAGYRVHMFEAQPAKVRSDKFPTVKPLVRALVCSSTTSDRERSATL